MSRFLTNSAAAFAAVLIATASMVSVVTVPAPAASFVTANYA